MRKIDYENLRTLLELYNGAVSLHVTSLLVVAFGQFSMLTILPIVKSYNFWVVDLAPFLFAYGVILVLATYFVSRYLGAMRRVYCIGRRMNERYLNLEAQIEREAPYSPRILQPIRNAILAGRYDTALYLSY
jgi:hypothetical protein